MTPSRAVRWYELEAAAPEFARRVAGRFTAHRHVLLATLRADGAPRLSGVETQFVDGDLFVGMMPGSLKSRDLRRDPRLALHSAPVDLTLAEGDAKLGGVGVAAGEEAIERVRAALAEAGHPAPPGPMDLWRVEVRDVTLTTVAGDHLVVEHWIPGAPVRTVEVH
jgi:hypothetical protein